MRALKRIGGKWVSALVADTPYQITSFGEDDAGNLYLTDYAAGSVFLVRGQ